MFSWMTLLVGAALAAPATSQKNFEVVKGEQSWAFSYRWKDAAGDKLNVKFSLPTDAVEADRDEVTWLQRKEMNTAVAQDVRKWGKSQKGVKVKVNVENGGVRTQVSGDRSKAKAALKASEGVRDAAVDAWLSDNGFTRLGKNISFDHAGLAASYADELAPVAAALRADAPDDRVFVERALSFVQSIPYEARKKKGGDPGYRRPLALLSRNRGDCDSKSVLFLAMVRAELPEVPLSVIYVPEHALTGVGLEAASTDRTFKADGVTFVYAEPVGPALHPLGEPADANKKAGKKGEVRIVPR
jgi:hypothetical protein